MKVIIYIFAIFFFTIASPHNFIFGNSQHHDSVKVKDLIQLGDNHEYNHPDSAIFYYQQAVDLCNKNLSESNPDSNFFYSYKSKALRFIGYISWNQGKYQIASEHFFSALKIAEQLQDRKGIFNCYNNIGIIHHKQFEYQQAIAYYNKALHIAEETYDDKGKSQVFTNMGNLYFDLAYTKKSFAEMDINFNLAYEYYSKALAVKEKLQDKKGILLCNNNIGNLLKKHGLFSPDKANRMKKFRIAASHYNKAIQVATATENSYGLSMIYGNIADLNLTIADSMAMPVSERKKYLDTAINYGTKAYNLSLEINSIYLQYEIAELLKNVYTSMGDYKNALAFANIFISTKDSIFSEEKTQALAEMLTKYETEKKEHEIFQKQAALDKSENQKILITGIAIIFFIIALSLLVIIVIWKKTSKLLKQKNKLLMESNATKDKFFSIIAHDLKTPVTGLHQLLQTINNKYDTFNKEQIHFFIQECYKTSEDLKYLLNNLLQWAKAHQHKIELAVQPVVLKLAIDELLNETAVISNRKKLQILNYVEPEQYIHADNNIVNTVLRNLLINAIKFSKEEQIIEVGFEETTAHYQIHVKDHGIGICKEDQQKLFNISVDTKTIGNSPEKGSGLGLILCYELISIHKGTIKVESELNKGSKFTIQLPKK